MFCYIVELLTGKRQYKSRIRFISKFTGVLSVSGYTRISHPYSGMIPPVKITLQFVWLNMKNKIIIWRVGA